MGACGVIFWTSRHGETRRVSVWSIVVVGLIALLLVQGVADYWFMK